MIRITISGEPDNLDLEELSLAIGKALGLGEPVEVVREDPEIIAAQSNPRDENVDEYMNRARRRDRN